MKYNQKTQRNFYRQWKNLKNEYLSFIQYNMSGQASEVTFWWNSCRTFFFFCQCFKHQNSIKKTKQTKQFRHISMQINQHKFAKQSDSFFFNALIVIYRIKRMNKNVALKKIQNNNRVPYFFKIEDFFPSIISKNSSYVMVPAANEEC